MSYRQDIVEELHALKREATHRLQTSAEEWRQLSREKANSLATDIHAILTDFRNALAHDEAEIERIFAGRTVPALATALAVGVAIGFFLRRKP